MKVTFETTTKVLEKIHISSSKTQEEIEQLRKEIENVSLVNDREYSVILIGLLKIKIENLIKEMKFLVSHKTILWKKNNLIISNQLLIINNLIIIYIIFNKKTHLI